jgi:hypothetical protein
MDQGNRPSFDEILALFQSDEFHLLPGADASAIRDSCEAIREWERRGGIYQ